MKDAIVEDVLGWDSVNGRGTDKGLFGTCEAFTLSVEEQGRKTLHMHIQVWIKKLREKREELNSEIKETRREAKNYICDEVDRVSSCSFLSDIDKWRKVIATFDHDGCSKPTRKRRRPIIVDDQTLRALRHSEGHKSQSYYAYCPDYTHTWTPG